jgi:hypothetical protein
MDYRCAMRFAHSLLVSGLCSIGSSLLSSAIAQEIAFDGLYSGTSETVYHLSEALCGPSVSKMSITVKQGVVEYGDGPASIKFPIASDGTFRNASQRGGGVGGVRYRDTIQGKISGPIVEANHSIRNRIIGGAHPTICEYNIVLKKD